MSVNPPDPSYSKPKSGVELPAVGTLHTWQDVQGKWGGNQTFLAKRDGRIICATLDRAKNPDAPLVMVVGHKPKNAQRAREFCNQGGSIPLFIKEAPGQWRYHGRFEIERFTDERGEVDKYQNADSGPLTRVIFLRRESESIPARTVPDIDFDAIGATEGNRRLVTHLAIERDRTLARNKKRQVLAKTGKLACEVCGFDFTVFYRALIEEFCEVHHRKALGDLNEGSVTELKDLAILCSNCHRVIHLIRPMPSVEDLRLKLAK